MDGGDEQAPGSGVGSGGDHGWLEGGHDPDDLIRQVARDAQLIQRRDQVAGDEAEVDVADAQSTVGRGDVGAAVTPGSAQCLAEEGGEVRPVPLTDTGGSAPEQSLLKYPARLLSPPPATYPAVT